MNKTPSAYTALSGQYKSASLLRRMAAFFYDALLLLAIYFLIGAVAVTINQGESIHRHWSLFILAVVFPLLVLCFYTWFWRRNGQTLGMQAWRIQLVAEEQTLPLKRCAVRFFFSLFSLACFGVGFLWILIDREKRTWQDIASDSKIVQLPKIPLIKRPTSKIPKQDA